jgi:hypothetical protein
MSEFESLMLSSQYKKLVKGWPELCGFASEKELIKEWKALGSPRLDPNAKVYLVRKEIYGEEEGEELPFRPGNVKWVNVYDDVELGSLLAPAIQGETGYDW